MLEIPIRENGEVRWVEVDPQLLKNVLRTKSKSSPTQFMEWFNLYNKKTTKKESLVYFKKHITDDLFKKIMEHTKEYIKSNDKVYRLDPIRYLKRNKWEDEIIFAPIDEKTTLEGFPLDKSGRARLGRCSNCNSIHFGDIFKIHTEDSSCCKAKLNKYKG
jgi:hypothetical protein